MIDVDARGRHEAERLRKEAARIADTEAALKSVLAGQVVVPLEPHRPAPSRPPVARRPVLTRRRIRLVVGGLVAAGLVAVLAVVGRNSLESQTAADVPANGLIAFAGNQGDGSSHSDIYVVAPDGTGLRALTSTPELAEVAPTWSPDGSRLAFVRSNLPPVRYPCTTSCQLVVVDPSSGVETFSADILVSSQGGHTWVPLSLAWSPDGRAIVTHSIACGLGGCGGGVLGSGINSVIADLETGALTTFTPPYEVKWSPDGEWFSLAQGWIPALLVVPADLIGTGDAVDVEELSGVRPLLARPDDDFGGSDFGGGKWMPDGSAIVVSSGERRSIDVVTVADGQRRTLIEDGFDPVVSPDGSQIAYLQESPSADTNDIWVVAADGSDPRRVTVSSTPPVWSPDGSLLLASDADGWFTVRPDGTERTQITPFTLPDMWPADFRPSWQPLPPGSSMGVVGATHVRSSLGVVRTQGA